MCILLVKAKGKNRGSFSSISFPTPLIKEVEKVVAEVGYWSTKTAFIHEAVMERLEVYKKELEVRRARKLLKLKESR